MLKEPRWLCIAILLLGGLISVGRASAASPTDDEEQSLRKRVEEFYTLMHAGKWTEAENYVAADSRERFHNGHKKEFLGSEVKSLELDEGGEGATVSVTVYNYSPISSKPLPFAHVTEWRRVNGVWFLELPKLEIGSADKAGGAAPFSPPEQLKFKGHRFGLGTVHAGETKVVRFPFTNVTDHTVTITSVELVSPCLKLRSEKKVYKPGESGELVIGFDPGTLEGEYAQTVVVKTDPGRITTRLLIFGVVAFRIQQKAEQSEGNMPTKSALPPEKPRN
jgi:hypothetical protein